MQDQFPSALGTIDAHIRLKRLQAGMPGYERLANNLAGSNGQCSLCVRGNLIALFTNRRATTQQE